MRNRCARSLDRAQRKQKIGPGHQLPRTKQCELLGIGRSGSYYRPVGVSPLELDLMRHIDEVHTDKPFLGSRRISDRLLDFDHVVNRKCVQRLMRVLHISAVYPKPSLSKPGSGHKVYPYLLRNREITGPNQAWAADITYIPMPKGSLYLVAVMDWYSRKVLSWSLSNTMAADFCVEALTEAMAKYGQPEIFNTDQGSQFTSVEFTDVLKKTAVKISMDGKGRWMDNVFIERLWRSLKYEEVYLKAYESVAEARSGIGTWIEYYNYERRHQSLNRLTPSKVYDGHLLPTDKRVA